VLYRNPWDCVKKVYGNEGGIKGFYRGVLPQLVGVAPEKVSRVVTLVSERKNHADLTTALATGAETDSQRFRPE
jgi:solute carrier family 25 aspartate/glutamate transporter 12/13